MSIAKTFLFYIFLAIFAFPLIKIITQGLQLAWRQIQLKTVNILVDYNIIIIVTTKVGLFYLIFKAAFAFSIIKIIT